MMSPSFKRLALTIALLAAPVGCSADDATDDEAGEAELSGSTAERRAEKLADFLRRGGTLQMPPTGQSGGAETLAVKVRHGGVVGDLESFARGSAKVASENRYDLPDAAFDRIRLTVAASFVENDTEFVSGVDGESVEDYLVNKLTKSARREELRALMNGVPGKYYRLLMSNRAAEIIGDEWIYIVPAARSATPIIVHLKFEDA